MSAQSPDFDTSETTMAAAAVDGHTIDSTNSSEQIKLNEILPDKEDGVAAEQVGDEPQYETGWRLGAVMTTIFLTTLLAALDIGIVATAIPAITDEFRQLDDVGWYGSACFLLVGTSSPMWGKLYKYLPTKLIYLASVALFLIGSIVAATAPNSQALIVARALQGWGCSGSLGGSVLMISYVAEPKKRPMLIGLWMGVFMCSTIVGPLIGGAFTSEVTWRWCFWINLPVGGPVILLVLLFFRVPKHIKPAPATKKEILLQLDLPGFTLLVTSLVCFTLALQWGGQSKAWSDGSVIATLVLWVVLTIAFVITEWCSGAYAMVPLSLLKPRMTWTNALYGYIENCANFQVLFYLPIYFQSIHGQSAIASGVNSLPFLAFFAVGSLLSGFLIMKTRLLQPYELASGLLAAAGAALLYTLDLDSSKARYIGPQVIFGFGLGLGSQIPMTALQAFSKPENVASTTGIMLMCNSISGAYFVTAAQSIFANRLLQRLASSAPNIDAAMVLATGATDIHRVFSGGDLVAVLEAYMSGIKDVFAFSMAGAAVTAVIALVIPFKKVPSNESRKTEEKVATAAQL
ncbi:Dehydrocurvularin exporter [Lachnellula hyalina]|uniref:Dehydrocurvularin exporter n=1 Tax=Lachnellula hyalina TaxID=1316788 RepID=A0A8H8R5Y5_9HELO|nr:Dehydrocurvularin exporter [Lachnellula hyalina]TVY27454.1 Dehydrocurvularin exporter [Lachnellula hyalina]